jgi:hypothetical protein
MILWNWVLFYFVVLTTTTTTADRCGSNWRQIKKRLYRSRRRWERKATNPDCYNMTVEKICFCAPAYRGPHNISVVHNKIQNTSEFATQMVTVKDLFHLVNENCVKNCPQSGAASCTVQFDPEYGFVSYLYVDPTLRIKDEEFGYNVTNLKFCNGGKHH